MSHNIPHPSWRSPEEMEAELAAMEEKHGTIKWRCRSCGETVVSREAANWVDAEQDSLRRGAVCSHDWEEFLEPFGTECK